MGQFLPCVAKSYSGAACPERLKTRHFDWERQSSSCFLRKIEDHCLFSLVAETRIFRRSNRKLEANEKRPVFIVFQIPVW